MKKTLIFAAAVLALGAGQAWAGHVGFGISIGLPLPSICIGASAGYVAPPPPLYVAPAPAYTVTAPVYAAPAPAPVYVAAPAPVYVAAPAPVYYPAPAVVYVGGPRVVYGGPGWYRPYGPRGYYYPRCR